jgi:2'-5' RNA ligase
MALDSSALLIPALEIDWLVGGFRMPFDPSARPGVPPHITIMSPFLDPNSLTSQLLRDLDSLFETATAFEYALTEVREFEQGVLYLSPEPAAPFIELTDLVSRRFALLPFAGAYAIVVPHLTVTRTAPSDERGRIAIALKAALPQFGRAAEAWLMVGNNETSWNTAHVIRFRPL